MCIWILFRQRNHYEVIKSSVEDLVPIPSDSEGIPDKMCDMPFHNNSPPLDILKDQFEGFSDSNDDSTSIDDDSFSIDDISDYVRHHLPIQSRQLVGVGGDCCPEVRRDWTLPILSTIKERYSSTRNKIFDLGIFTEDKVVNSGILAADEEKSPHPSSHRGLRAFNGRLPPWQSPKSPLVHETDKEMKG
ncbi:hypothetical protein Tco_1216816 [Tanacetum coccineum]